MLVNNAGIMTLANIADSDDAALRPPDRDQPEGQFQHPARGGPPAARRRPDHQLLFQRRRPAAADLRVYAATKAGVEAMTSVLAKELRGRDITVNAIAPGPTATDLFLNGKSQELIDRLEARPARAPGPARRHRRCRRLPGRAGRRLDQRPDPARQRRNHLRTTPGVKVSCDQSLFCGFPYRCSCRHWHLPPARQLVQRAKRVRASTRPSSSGDHGEAHRRGGRGVFRLATMASSSTRARRGLPIASPSGRCSSTLCSAFRRSPSRSCRRPRWRWWIRASSRWTTRDEMASGLSSEARRAARRRRSPCGSSSPTLPGSATSLQRNPALRITRPACRMGSMSCASAWTRTCGGSRPRRSSAGRAKPGATHSPSTCSAQFWRKRPANRCRRSSLRSVAQPLGMRDTGFWAKEPARLAVPYHEPGPGLAKMADPHSDAVRRGRSNDVFAFTRARPQGVIHPAAPEWSAPLQTSCVCSKRSALAASRSSKRRPPRA